MKVLVVDDEPGIRGVCRRALQSRAVEVDTASTGEEALERLDGGYDLVVTDLAMPGEADGIKVLREARGRGASVILMSAYPDLGSALAALHRGAFDFLLKPFSVAELRDSFERWKASRGPEGAVDGGRSEAKPPAVHVAERSATALFADIRGFSRFAAAAPPGDVGQALSEVLEPAMEAVRSSGGAVQQVLGDGFLALFGGSPEESAGAAAEAALLARRRAEAVSSERSRAGAAPLPMGFGLERGLVRVESLGGAWRGQPTVVGHSVNLAARLEKAAGAGRVLVGPEAGLSLLGRFRLEPVAPLTLHGFDQPTPAFLLLDHG